jgi:hypothetical protein
LVLGGLAHPRVALVTSHHNPATRFRHIPASWQGGNEHLAGLQEWLGFVLLTTGRDFGATDVVGASSGAR